MCAPSGVRILLSIATLSGWRVYEADVKEAFLHAGPSERPIYARKPMESSDKKWFFWVLKAATYGLVHTHIKWETQIDMSLLSLCLSAITCFNTAILHGEAQISRPAAR